MRVFCQISVFFVMFCDFVEKKCCSKKINPGIEGAENVRVALLRASGPEAALEGHRALASLTGDDPVTSALGKRLGRLLAGRAVASRASKGSNAKSLQMLRKALSTGTQSKADSLADQRKEFALLRHITAHAIPGDAESVLQAAEHFANRSSFLKFAGGAKRLLLEQALDKAPKGLAVELGSYIGYSSVVLGSRPRLDKVVTVELEPINARHAIMEPQCGT